MQHDVRYLGGWRLMKEIASHLNNRIDILHFFRPEHAHRRIMKNQLSCVLTCCCFSSCDSEEDKNSSLLRLRDPQGSRRECVTGVDPVCLTRAGRLIWIMIMRESQREKLPVIQWSGFDVWMKKRTGAAKEKNINELIIKTTHEKKKLEKKLIAPLSRSFSVRPSRCYLLLAW